MVSCSSDGYETGDGTYSRLRADFVVAYAGSDKMVDRVLTDGGDTLATAPPFTVKWITKADSAYRALLYYERNDGENGQPTARPITIEAVPVLKPTPTSQIKTPKTDPVTFESAWMSDNKKYANIAFYVKTGQANAKDQAQAIGLMADSTATNADGTATLCLTFYHDQAGVPEYYSSKGYASIPIGSIHADSMQLTINTYEGKITKKFKINH